jgi:hypothetical protein
VVALVAALLAVLAPGAEARSVRISGQVIAPPLKAKGGRVSVPVLLTAASQRRLKLRQPIARLLIKRTRQVRVPAAVTSRSVQAAELRPGDELRARVKRRRQRSAGTVSMRASGVRVVHRESFFSVDELTGAVLALSRQVTSLSARVAALAADIAELQRVLGLPTTGGGGGPVDLSSILDRLDALEADVNDLQALVGALQGTGTLSQQVADLQDAVGDLQSTVNGICALAIVTSCD